MKSGSFIVLGIWLLLACQEIKDCGLESSTDYAIAGYYVADSAEKTPRVAKFNKVYEVGVSNYYISNVEDTIADDSVQLVGLPVYDQAEQVTYIFETDSVDYELDILYKPHLRIYYDNCDPVFSFKLDTVLSTTFDSVVVVNPALDRVVPENIEIYF
ncbi:hypothetical protein [Marinoscillum furvescens]|uniref:Uncharacterized protein n=1 Tax=Marinoscillum furvescens DSM 4134 TaxID=1122208 RepID=A0A3D9L474_MARFU|nr:hypothetical protein [Marinoscillum furvescens]RED98874.1 hypothetical protein C7460_10966 [Marinoscillum furvescens DSM 4134]